MASLDHHVDKLNSGVSADPGLSEREKQIHTRSLPPATIPQGGVSQNLLNKHGMGKQWGEC
jgi:hypothetical protein